MQDEVASEKDYPHFQLAYHLELLKELQSFVGLYGQWTSEELFNQFSRKILDGMPFFHQVILNASGVRAKENPYWQKMADAVLTSFKEMHTEDKMKLLTLQDDSLDGNLISQLGYLNEIRILKILIEGLDDADLLEIFMPAGIMTQVTLPGAQEFCLTMLHALRFDECKLSLIRHIGPGAHLPAIHNVLVFHTPENKVDLPSLAILFETLKTRSSRNNLLTERVGEHDSPLLFAIDHNCNMGLRTMLAFVDCAAIKPELDKALLHARKFRCARYDEVIKTLQDHGASLTPEQEAELDRDAVVLQKSSQSTRAFERGVVAGNEPDFEQAALKLPSKIKSKL